MTKKKKLSEMTPTTEQIDALRTVVQMTPEQLRDIICATEELRQIPDNMCDLVCQYVEMMANMPKAERDSLFKKMEQLGNMYDSVSQEYDEEDYDDEENDEEDEESTYPHFLPRANVKKYTLCVSIRNIKPSIYRKFNVPSNMTLRHLSELLVELMGWDGTHLNQFRKGDSYYAPAYQRENELPDLFGAARNYNQEDYTISDILKEKGKDIEWEYDFGDSWYHDVRLSSVGEYKKDEPLVSFVKGEHECPPEDCGGIWGYGELLAIYDKKKARKRLTDEDKERLEWYSMDEDFDPEYFDTEFAKIICEDYCE